MTRGGELTVESLHSVDTSLDSNPSVVHVAADVGKDLG